MISKHSTIPVPGSWQPVGASIQKLVLPSISDTTLSSLMWNLWSYPTTVLNERMWNVRPGVKTYSDPLLHIFRGQDPEPPGSTPLLSLALSTAVASDSYVGSGRSWSPGSPCPVHHTHHCVSLYRVEMGIVSNRIERTEPVNTKKPNKNNPVVWILADSYFNRYLHLSQRLPSH